MKKTIAAVTAGLLLVAGQAAAANTSTVRVGDRLGATAGEASEFAGVPLPVLIIGAAIIIGGFAAATDDGESD